MARMEDMLPPGEIVRWRSPKRSWASYSGATLAVTEAHIVWVGDGDRKVALCDIAAIDAEEGGATLNLHLDGETRRIEEIGGDVEEAARATGRPAHIAWALAVSGDAEGARGVIRQLGQLNLALLTYHHRAQILAYAALALARVE